MRSKVYLTFGLLICLISFLYRVPKPRAESKTDYTYFSKSKPLKEVRNHVKIKNKNPRADDKSLAHNLIPEKSYVIKMVETEALQLYNMDNDPNGTEYRLRSLAQSFNGVELNELTLLVLNLNADPDERTLALYLMSLVGPTAQPFLIKIFFSPSPILEIATAVHSFQEKQQEREYSLKTMALAAIEKNIHQTKKSFTSTEKLKNSYLNGLLKIVRLGEKMKTPMLKQFIDQNLKMETL